MKTLKSTLMIGIVFLIIAAPGKLLAKKKVDLKYNLSKNDKFVTKSVVNQYIQFQVQGKSMNIRKVNTEDVTTVVSNVASDMIELTTTINKITLTQTANGRKIYFDSSNPKTYESGTGKLIGENENKMIGKSYQEIKDALGNVKVDQNDAGNNNKITGSLNAEDIYVIFPGHSVEVGDSWQADITPRNNKKILFHVTYTLNKISDNEAIIGIEAKIAPSKTAGNLTIAGEVNGEATVDISTGWTTKLHVDQEVKRGAVQMTAPMTISGSIDMTSVKK